MSLPNPGGLKTIFNGTPRGAEMAKKGKEEGAEVFEEGGVSL